MWKSVLRPLFFILPAETAHHVGMACFSALMSIGPMRRWLQRRTRVSSPRLESEVAGLKLPNPVGLAAGFDKDGKWFHELAALGFGFVEIGTVTGEPQPGNPTPRLFRLKKDHAIINRMGFNNDGAEKAEQRVRDRDTTQILGINIGKSKVVDNEHAVDDYLKSFRLLGQHADYVVVNVSSPNTPGLRELQAKEPLQKLLSALRDANREQAEATQTARKPMFVKLAPDLHPDAVQDAVEVALECGLDGIIATNTTNSREGLSTSAKRVEEIGAGGLSGGPLTTRSREFVAEVYRLSRGQLPIIGVGGIMTPEDAWQMIRAGASAVQVYTGFIYGGPLFAAQIARHLDQRLEEHGLSCIKDAVGSAVNLAEISESLGSR